MMLDLVYSVAAEHAMQGQALSSPGHFVSSATRDNFHLVGWRLALLDTKDI